MYKITNFINRLYHILFSNYEIWELTSANHEINYWLKTTNINYNTNEIYNLTLLNKILVKIILFTISEECV